MGDCTYCGKKAGLFKSYHPECAAKHSAAIRKIISLVESAGACAGPDLVAVENDIEEIAQSNNIKNLKEYLVQGFERSVELAFDDGLLSEDEENSLAQFKTHFDLDQNDLNKNGMYTKLIQGAVLRDIMEGKIPERATFNFHIPFNLQKSEQLIWVFQGVRYLKQQRRTKYVGGSQGFSVRIAKGLYYRAGAYKGKRIDYHETVHADTGLLGVTDKHIYFTGDAESFRIRLDKIVSFEPFEDGIGIQRDAATAKPQLFVTDDGWFTHNLITNVAKM